MRTLACRTLRHTDIKVVDEGPFMAEGGVPQGLEAADDVAADLRVVRHLLEPKARTRPVAEEERTQGLTEWVRGWLVGDWLIP